MDEESRPVCFHCGLPTGSTRTLNRLPSGEPCPHCQARLLEDLAPALPGMGQGLPADYGGIGAEPYETEETRTRRELFVVEPEEGGWHPDDPIAG